MPRSIISLAIVPVTIAVTGFVVVGCLILYSLMRADMTAEDAKQATYLGKTVVTAARDAMLRDDRNAIGAIIGNIGNQEGVAHVRIFNARGLVMFSSNAAEIHRPVNHATSGCSGCHASNGAQRAVPHGAMRQARMFTNADGEPVIAITVPIPNEKGCAASSCHVHPPEHAILGTLDIGLSAAPLLASLAGLKARMILFCLMVLVLTAGGAAAMLRRSVFVPLRHLAAYAGRPADPLPQRLHRAGREIALVADQLHAQALQITESRAMLSRQRVAQQAAAAHKSAGQALADDNPEPGEPAHADEPNRPEKAAAAR